MNDVPPSRTRPSKLHEPSLSHHDIASSVLAQRGYSEDAGRTRTGQNLRYLERMGRVAKEGDGKAIRWRLA